MGVIITTTNNISCYSIKEYRGAVCANQVLGANVFADFLASWTDFLGGKSGAYRDVLDELFADVRKQMIDKATDVGALEAELVCHGKPTEGTIDDNQ